MDGGRAERTLTRKFVEKDRTPARLRAALRRKLRLARVVLAWESLWPVLWPAVALAGLFVAVALFDVLPLLPGWVHAALLAAFAGAFLAALAYAVRGFRLPDDDRARRRVERDSDLAHRPIGTLDDRLAEGPAGDPVARGLWRLHRQRMTETIRRLRVAAPAPGVPARDPWGLRAAVLLLLVIAVAGTWGDMPPRLYRAVTPAWSAAPDQPITLQMWLTPPQYTGRPPTLIEVPSEAPPPAPAVPGGSTVLALLHGGEGTAELELDRRALPFTPLGDGGQRVETAIGDAAQIAVRLDGRRVGQWRVTVVPDAPPSIRFSEQPSGDPGGRLRLAYEAADDYGVTKAWASIRRDTGPADEEPLLLELPLPGGQNAVLRHASWHDLTAHPWAGLPVTLEPNARDAAGQVGKGAPIRIVLPEREFHHPVARAIIAQRRLLADDPPPRHDVARRLDGISALPDAFGNDTVAFLSLRTARARLLRDQSAGAVDSVRDILWNTALRIEEGNRAVAERAVAEAARELEKALSENASQAEIDRLMDQLQQAMEQLLDAIAEQAMRQDNTPFMPDPSAQYVTPRELESMLDRMRDLARTGSREAAQQMLSQLQDMLRNLQAGRQGQPSPEAQQAQQALGQLGELARQQRSLLDQTFRQSQQGASPEEAGEGAARQEALRRALGDVMRQLGEGLGEIPGALGEAEQAMRDATGQLRQNAPGSAVQSQGEALERLQQGAQQAMQALSRQMGMGMGMPSGMPTGQGFQRDPLGRALNGPGAPDDRSVHVPDEGDLHRSREILEELRRRLGDPQRPGEERDYLRRLLRQF